MDRRTFLAASASSLAAPSISFAKDSDVRRVAVIGHTGRGNFGHGLDTVWLRIPETEIVGVADANQSGLLGAMKKLKVDNGYTDYRKMLKELKPSLVAVCPRQPDQHRDMILEAIDSGAKGIYVEKPFCRTPAEADEIIAACNQHNVKLAVAHRNRYHPTLQAIDKLIADGDIGRLLEIRGRGKGDRRGGSEDLWVLGSHVLNLVNYFGGDPGSCSAILLQNGRPVTRADVHEGNEALGLLAGNEVHARYEMERGFMAYFDSIANDGTQNAGFGLQIIGSEGFIDINCDKFPLAYLVRGNPFQPTAKPRPWIPITSAGAGKPEPIKDIVDLISHHIRPAQDLIAAIRDNHEPLCNVREATTTVEMICATFASHCESGRTVEIPLKHRDNPLARL